MVWATFKELWTFKELKNYLFLSVMRAAMFSWVTCILYDIAVIDSVWQQCRQDGDSVLKIVQETILTSPLSSFQSSIDVLINMKELFNICLTTACMCVCEQLIMWFPNPGRVWSRPSTSGGNGQTVKRAVTILFMWTSPNGTRVFRRRWRRSSKITVNHCQHLYLLYKPSRVSEYCIAQEFCCCAVSLMSHGLLHFAL